MCLLTYFPAGVLPDADALRCGAQCNNDGHGFGILIPGQEDILVFKSMNAAEAIDEFVRMRAQYPEGPALFHSRLTTHGNTGVDNCHPFVVNGDPRTVVAHNGILPTDAHPKKIGTTVVHKTTKDKVPYQVIENVYDDRSDTRILADDLLMARWSNLDSRHSRKRLTAWLGRSNKILVLTTDPTYRRNAYLFNSGLGEWVGGVWYSNSSFRGYGRRTASYGSWYGSGVYPSDDRSYRSAGVDSYGTEWDDLDWDADEPAYDGEAAYGYVKNGRGVWVPPTRDRFRNDDAATWPVTLGGTREAPQESTRAQRAPWVTFVTCDLCGAQSVDAEYGLCYDCWGCQDCYGAIKVCDCYGAPRIYSYTFLELHSELSRNGLTTLIRSALQRYRNVCANLQRADELRAARRAAETVAADAAVDAAADAVDAAVAALRRLDPTAEERTEAATLVESSRAIAVSSDGTATVSITT